MSSGTCKIDNFNLTNFPGDSAEGNTNFRRQQGEAAGECSPQSNPVRRCSSTGDAAADGTSEEDMGGLSQEGLGLPKSGSLLAGSMPLSVAGLLGADMTLGELTGSSSDHPVVRT